jgi:hypothetical protein
MGKHPEDHTRLAPRRFRREQWRPWSLRCKIGPGGSPEMRCGPFGPGRAVRPLPCGAASRGWRWTNRVSMTWICERGDLTTSTVVKSLSFPGSESKVRGFTTAEVGKPGSCPFAVQEMRIHHLPRRKHAPEMPPGGPGRSSPGGSGRRVEVGGGPVIGAGPGHSSPGGSGRRVGAGAKMAWAAPRGGMTLVRSLSSTAAHAGEKRDLGARSCWRELTGSRPEVHR